MPTITKIEKRLIRGVDRREGLSPSGIGRGRWILERGPIASQTSRNGRRSHAGSSRTRPLPRSAISELRTGHALRGHFAASLAHMTHATMLIPHGDRVTNGRGWDRTSLLIGDFQSRGRHRGRHRASASPAIRRGSRSAVAPLAAPRAPQSHPSGRLQDSVYGPGHCSADKSSRPYRARVAKNRQSK